MKIFDKKMETEQYMPEAAYKLFSATRKFFGIGLKNTIDEEQRKAVNEHKYLLSEKAGHDVGWKSAYSDWKKKYFKLWKQKRKLHEEKNS